MESINALDLAIWKICNKIWTALNRMGLGGKFQTFFLQLDPTRNGWIDEQDFRNLLNCSFKEKFCLSLEEVQRLAEHFVFAPGKTSYKELCDLIDGGCLADKDFVTGLEFEDPKHVNPLAEHECRRLLVMMTKIAQIVRLREIPLRAYFYDYEILSNNHGTVTLDHFFRVLRFLKIQLSKGDFDLLLKRFRKDSYTLNYVAFVEKIEQILSYFDDKGLNLDRFHDLKENFPTHTIDSTLPTLPRPEIGTVDIASIYGRENAFHPALKPKREKYELIELLYRIQRHIRLNQIRIWEFFEGFDPLKTGFITKSQFERCLDAIGVSRLHRLYLTQEEINDLSLQYADRKDSSRACWRTFVADVDRVFMAECRDTKSYEIIKAAQKPGKVRWADQTEERRYLAEEAIFRLKKIIQRRRIPAESLFNDHDRFRNGHVTKSQFRQVVWRIGAVLSEEEAYALEQRYCDEIGFDYVDFLREADPRDIEEPKYPDFLERKVKANQPRKLPKTRRNLDIVAILGRIRAQAVRKGIRIVQFMEGFDHHHEDFITKSEFERGLSSASIDLNSDEVWILSEIFHSPLRPNCVDYRRFCVLIEEAFSQRHLERAPLITPVPHIPTHETEANFLNFEERTIVSKALQKLARHSADIVSNLSDVFQDFDKANCGSVSRDQLLKALTMREINTLVSTRELETICKCFAVERGFRLEFNYRAFLQALDHLFATRIKYPF